MDLQTYLKIIVDLNIESQEVNKKEACSHFIYHTIRHHKVCSICHLVLNYQRKDSIVKSTKIIKLPEWIPLKTIKEADKLYACVNKEIKPSMRTAVLYACVTLCKNKLSYKESEDLIKFFKLSIKRIETAVEFIFSRIPSYKLDLSIRKEPILNILIETFNLSAEIGLYLMHYCKYHKKSFKTIWVEMNRKFKFEVSKYNFYKVFVEIVLHNMPFILAEILALKQIFTDCIKIDGSLVKINAGKCSFVKIIPMTLSEWNKFLNASYVYDGKIIHFNFSLTESKIEGCYFSHNKFLLRSILCKKLFGL
ncbi:hypothetical protein LDVICp087 [lymphocystis disease virus-China]|uniref:Uncharacterized protein n=2 Tax=Lymphocystis disease virus 2 TaxID=159183 RepID=A0A6F8WZZ3_9VIRU|nr:hypothetical protein LDVICp087 [lymphocystis disease virus-China]AAU10932.1 hypothetical protein [lymphocystis disease virus-China]BCB67462.1 hypothetical protein [Lymphocystis disease virus 2]